jgi:hypothetical protein
VDLIESAYSVLHVIALACIAMKTSTTHTAYQFHSTLWVKLRWPQISVAPGTLLQLVDACQGLRDRNQQFLTELADLVCHLTIRKYLSVCNDGYLYPDIKPIISGEHKVASHRNT